MVDWDDDPQHGSMGKGVKEGRRSAQATINQDLDLIKSCIEVTRVAARRAAVFEREGRCSRRTEIEDVVAFCSGY